MSREDRRRPELNRKQGRTIEPAGNTGSEENEIRAERQVEKDERYRI